MLALAAVLSAVAAPPAAAGFSDGSIPDAIAACEGRPYDIVERDGDLYVACHGATLDWMRFSAAVVVDADEAVARVTVTRDGAGSGRRALLRWSTIAGSAVEGRDYVQASNAPLYFDDLETTRTLTVPLLDDPAATASRSFTVTFSDGGSQNLVVPVAQTVTLPFVVAREPETREPETREPEPGGPGTGEPGTGEPGTGEPAPGAPGVAGPGVAGPGSSGPEAPAHPGAGGPAAGRAGTPPTAGAGRPAPRPRPGAGGGKPRRPTARRVVTTATVRFGAGCWRPSARDRARLERLRARVRGARLVRVVGHADASGERTANVRLAGRRARSVARLLLDGRGVARPRRVEVRNAGLSRPAASNDTLAGRALNRRVTIRIVTTG